MFDGNEQDSIEYSDLLQSSQFSSLSSSQVPSNPDNAKLVSPNHKISSAMEGQEPEGDQCESPVIERPASCAEDTHSLSSDSSLSILSPETSLQGHIEPDSLGLDNVGYEEGSCSSSLRKEEGVSTVIYCVQLCNYVSIYRA